jgi:hypothetical protein
MQASLFSPPGAATKAEAKPLETQFHITLQPSDFIFSKGQWSGFKRLKILISQYEFVTPSKNEKRAKFNGGHSPH